MTLFLAPVAPEIPIIPECTAVTVVQKAEAKLNASQINCLPCSHHKGTSTETVYHHELELGEKIGEGSFSSVYEVKSIRHNPTEALVLKVLKPSLMARPALFSACSSDLVREGLLLSRLSHPNVLSCRATGPDGLLAYLSGHHDAFFLVLERLDETLKQRLTTWRQLPEKKSGVFSVFGSCRQRAMQKTLSERVDAVCDLAEAVRYLHSERIMHRDLKPDNMGFDAEGCLKVFDLDVCRILPQEAQSHPNKTFKFTKNMGRWVYRTYSVAHDVLVAFRASISLYSISSLNFSPRYMAPEVARGQSYNAKSDVYSFALLMWEILSLEKPYGELTADSYHENVRTEGMRPACPSNWPSALKSLLKECWAEDLSSRPTMEEVTRRLRNDLNKTWAKSARRHDDKRINIDVSETDRTIRSDASL